MQHTLNMMFSGCFSDLHLSEGVNQYHHVHQPHHIYFMISFQILICFILG